MRKSYVKIIIVGQLNINSLSNEFLSIKELLSHNLDLLILKEIKLEDTFSNAQFQMNGYKCLQKIGPSLLEFSVFTLVRIFHLNKFILDYLKD